jgi:DNA-binding beta-propeller fold protein YncE
MGGEVKSMRGFVLAFATLVFVAGCGRVPGGPAPASDYKLYEAAATGGSQQLSVIDSRSHSVDLNMPLGTPSPDWTHLYTLNGALLVDLDPQTGATLHTLRLPGYYQLPPADSAGVPGGLSQNGQWLVLESHSVANTSGLLLVDTSYAKPPSQIDLNGDFTFDAVSNDGDRIFLIEHVSKTHYFVRRFDVRIGNLDPNVIFDKSDGNPAMAGLRLSGMASPDGSFLYSVYIRQDKSAFIHALSLGDLGIAYCIELPGSGPWSLALSADGTHLYAANGAGGIVADVAINGNAPPAIARVSQIGGGRGGESRGGAVLSTDGKTLVIGGPTGLVWVDTASLHTRDRQLGAWTVSSVALSSDGTTLYAVNDAGMIAELRMEGSHTPTTFGGPAGQPLELIRVEAVQTP